MNACGSCRGRNATAPAPAARACPSTSTRSSLSITERAVEKHVSAIFTKLDLPPSQAHHRRVLAVVTYLNS
jgi:hypothetical protein